MVQFFFFIRAAMSSFAIEKEFLRRERAARKISQIAFEEGIRAIEDRERKANRTHGTVKKESNQLERFFRFSLHAAPVLMAAVLVATWWIKFERDEATNLINIAAVVLFLIVLFLLGAYQRFQNNPRATFDDSSTSISFAFLIIGLFGAAYALCEVFGPTSLLPSNPEFHYLGYAFLMSTSIGIAGGILGEPGVWPRIIAHIQLLLFLSGLALVFARLLRLEVRSRR
jgi:cation transport ATPase